ncbi:MAG: hypothetical protein GY720_03070, partial [bacterium]|nr:hypothetical protein [bacterium]
SGLPLTMLGAASVAHFASAHQRGRAFLPQRHDVGGTELAQTGQLLDPVQSLNQRHRWTRTRVLALDRLVPSDNYISTRRQLHLDIPERALDS